MFTKFFECLAHTFKDVYSYIEQMLSERNPINANKYLINWEKDLGLPESCSKVVSTEEERRVIAHTKYTTFYNTLNKQFYLDYASSIGSTIRITEKTITNQPFRVSKNRVDRLNGDMQFARLWAYGASYTWIVEILKIDKNKNYLKCKFFDFKPAHTILLWKEIDFL